MKLNWFSSFVSLALTPLLVTLPICAQSPTPGLPSAGEPAEVLQIRLVDAEQKPVQAGSRSVNGFKVEVTDSAGAAVKDAAVVFRLPDSGATGSFADGTHSAVVYTTSSGNADTGPVQWSGEPGPTTLRITATKSNSHAGLLFEQAIAPNQPESPKSLAAIPAKPALPPPAPAQIASPQAPVIISSSPGTATTTAKPEPATPIAKEPSVSVTRTSNQPGISQHSGKAKWFIIAAVAAGAGIGFAMAGKGKSSSGTTTQSSSTSIGSPTVSIGNP